MIRPARLAVADHARLAVGLRMQGDDLFEEYRFGARDVLDGLARHGLRQEADEIAGMTGLERDADFAVGLEAADAGAMSRARVDHDKGPARRIDFDAGRRNDPHQDIIDGPVERAAVNDKLDLVVEHVRRGLGQMLAVLVAALAHDVPEQDAALRGVDRSTRSRARTCQTAISSTPLRGCFFVLTALLRSFYASCPPAGKSIQSCSLKAALIGSNRVNIPQERFGSSPADQFSSSSGGLLRTASRLLLISA